MNSTPLTLEALAVRITALEKIANENHEAHGAIYARIEAVEKGHVVLDTSLTDIWTVLKEIQADLKELKEKPGKRWDMVVSESIKWVVLAALGAMVVFK
jgi:hypothetical protein